MLNNDKRDKSVIRILQILLVLGLGVTSLNAAAGCNCCTPQKPKPVTTVPFKSSLPNHCTKWIIIPIEDGFHATVQIYDPSITEHDHDCDGIVDSQDPDVDNNGIVVVKDSAYIKKGQAVYIDVIANDMDLDVGGYIDRSSLQIYSQPTHGSAEIHNGKVQYTPHINYIGTDSFTYVVRDNTGMLSRPTHVYIYIGEPNHAPKAFDGTYETKEDTSVSIVLKATDIDHDRLKYTLVRQPKHGKIEGKVPHLVYKPHKDYFGEDSFTFRVNDGKVDSALATVRLAVLSVNDNPIANDDVVKTEEGRPVAILPLKNDIDPDGNSSKLEIVSIGTPMYGIVRQEGNDVYYTPKSHSATSDSVTYTIEDEEGGQDAATIRIDIATRNDAPVAYNQSIKTEEEHAVSFELNATDPDGDDINYTIAYQPQHGSLNGKAPHLTYMPSHDFNGIDYITFKVNDGNLESNVALVTITVEPVNDPPVADAGTNYTGIRGDTVSFDASGSYDIDGHITSYVWQEGNVTLSHDKTFEHQMMREGVHTVTLTVTDDKNATGSDEKIVTIDPCCDGCNYPDPTTTNPYN